MATTRVMGKLPASPADEEFLQHLYRGGELLAQGKIMEARESLERALAINPEETGALTALGELALVQGRDREAVERLEWASRTNPRAVGPLFLRAYIAFKHGADAEARRLLAAAHAARGPDWKPKGTAGEGDVKRKMHVEGSLLSRYWEEWDGTADPRVAFLKPGTDGTFPALRAKLH